MMTYATTKRVLAGNFRPAVGLIAVFYLPAMGSGLKPER